MRQQIIEVQKLTDKPFAVSLIVDGNLTFTGPITKVVLEEKVPVVLLNGVDEKMNETIVKPLKAAGVKILLRPLTPTIETAKLAEKMDIDIYVATGFDEGGTLPERVVGTFSLIPMIADAIDIPVLAAGGIGDVRGVRAAFALGAEGAYVGSAFIPTVENPANNEIKQMIVDSSAEDLLLFKTMPAYYRSLPTQLGKELSEMDKNGSTRSEIAAKMQGTSKMREGMLEGKTEGYVSVGTGISQIKSIRTVKEAVADFMQDF